MVVFFSFVSLITWVGRLFPWSRYNFVFSFLNIPGTARDTIEGNENKRESIRNLFVQSYLRQDGVFLLRFVNWNAGIGITWALFDQLYVDFGLLKADADQINNRANNIELDTKV